MTEPDEIVSLRKKYCIPDIFRYWGTTECGDVHFDHCDSTIAIHPDGKATHSWMGLSVATNSHCYYTEEVTYPSGQGARSSQVPN